MLAWWVAGALLVVVMVVLGYPILSGSSSSGPQGLPSGEEPPTESGAVDLTTMPLAEQATRLFNRVMTSNSTGDTADVAFFLPKAITIYEQVAPTDPDGLYHFTLLHLVGGDFAAALAKAQEGLAQIPDYLLLLAAGAEASLGLGDEETARAYYSRFLEVYDTEMGMARAGYDHHQRILPTYREDARAYLGRS
jgi:tetratricopeptide (TPR) repeat protein